MDSEHEDEPRQDDEHDARRQVPELMVQAWEKAIGEPDPLIALGATRALRAHLSTWETTLVEEAVADGASWAAVGESVGVSRQAAWDRFHHDVGALRKQVQRDVHELRQRYRDEARELRHRYRDEMGVRGRRRRPPVAD